MILSSSKHQKSMIPRKLAAPFLSLFPFFYFRKVFEFPLPMSSHTSVIPQNPISVLLLVTLLLGSALPFSSSLSSVAISQVSNQTFICALTGDTSLNCTSFTSGLQSPIPPTNVSIYGITAGNDFICYMSYKSLTSANCTVGCWRFSSDDTSPTYKRIYHGPMLSDLDARNSQICGIVNGSNSLICWQWPDFTPPNVQNLTSISVGGDFVCGLLGTGQVKCFGNNTSIVGKEPAGVYMSIAAGLNQACVISIDGTAISCWGQTPTTNLTGGFNSLALGNNTGCAVLSNFTVFCWGENNFKLPTNLEGNLFMSITGKSNVFCGVMMSNFSLICWGSENSTSSSVLFQSVMAGPCQQSCSCGKMPDYGNFCSSGFICLPCRPRPSPAAVPTRPSLPPRASSPPALTNTGPNSINNVDLAVGCVGMVAILFIVCLYCYRYYKKRVLEERFNPSLDRQGSTQIFPLEENSSTRGSSFDPPKIDKRLIRDAGSGKVQRFTLEELRQATDNFSDGHKIGGGGYGSVYRAILEDGREIAIKRAEATVSNSPLYACKKQDGKGQAFCSEVALLSRLNHKNLVQLYGFCNEANEQLLVYEFMVNGSLHDHLHNFTDSPILNSWATRIKVALDAARGIEYLHTYAVPQIIHRDIKTSNILLNGQWIAKVSDFGLSLMGPEDDEGHISLRAAGTVGYMDPAYYKYQQLTTKSDVYSFGVVLLELLSGRKAIHPNEETGLPRNVVSYMVPYIVRDEIHRVLDPKLPPPTPCEIEAVAYVGYLAADCVVTDGRDRPTMTEIVDSLERALAACLTNPFLSRSTTGSSIVDIL